MATYLQGVTDYLPHVQPWTPDFNFYQNVLERKQQKYDIGWEQVNSVYNSILNAPMMREQNIERRDNFFKNVENQLQRMASVDLSLPQNVDAAAQVFRPFYEDDNIVKDIGFTKRYQDELQRAEYFRTCTDMEKCGNQYWEGGVRALQYQAQDFIDATDEEALRHRNPEYTPYVNFMELATKAAKEADLSVKFDSLEGGYIVTTKNGPELQMPLMNFFMSRFGDDPRLQKYYNTKAYLMTKENPDLAMQIYEGSMANPGLSSEENEIAARENYVLDTYDNSKKVIENSKEKETNRFQTLIKRRRVLEQDIERNGIIPGSDEANTFNQLVNDVGEQEKVVGKLDEYGNMITSTDAGLGKNGLAGNEDQVRAVIAGAMQMQDMFGASVALSYKDYERTMKADQFALEQQRHNNRTSLAKLKQTWAWQEKAVDFIFDRELKNIEVGIENGTLDSYGNSWILNSNSTIFDLLDGQGGVEGMETNIGNMTNTDRLIMSLLSGSMDPYSGTTIFGGAIQDLIDKGEVEGALLLSQMSNRGGMWSTDPNAGGIPPEVDFDTDDATENVNILLNAVKDADSKSAIKTALGTVFPMFAGEALDYDEDDIIAMRGDYKKAWSFVQGRLALNNQGIETYENMHNQTNLAVMLNTASDIGDPESDKAQIEMLSLGQVIDSNLKSLGKAFGGNDGTFEQYNSLRESGYGSLPALSKEEFDIIKGMPTDTKNIDNVNADYYRKVQNVGAEKIIQLAGGNKQLYEFMEAGNGVWVEDANAGKWIDKSSVEMIDDQTYFEYANMIHSEASEKFNNPSYIDPNITDEMRKAASDYEMYNNGATFERHYGSGSKLSDLEAYNGSVDAMAARSWRSFLSDSNDKAINVWNTGLMNAQSNLKDWLASGSTSSDQVRNIIIDNIIKKGKDGELWEIADDYDVVNAIAHNIPDLNSDPSWMQRNMGILHNRWGASIADIDSEYAKNGSLDKKAIFNLLSVSEYASTWGAEEEWAVSKKPVYSTYSHEYIPAIAGWKYHEDQQLPADQRKYSSLRDATIETIKEDPYRGENYLDYNSRNTYGITEEELWGKEGELMKFEAVFSNAPDNPANPGIGEHFEANDQLFLQWLGKYSNIIETDRKDGTFTSKPTYSFWDYYAGSEHKKGENYTPGELSFQLKDADVAQDYVNIFSENNDAIGRVYSEFLKEFSDQPSSFGGLFTNEEGEGLGQGSLAAPTTNLRDVTPSKKNAGYYNSVAIFEDAVNRGVFEGAGADNAKLAIQMLNNQMDDQFKKGHAPNFDISIHPLHGAYNVTQYELTFTDPQWAMDQKFNQYNNDAEDGTNKYTGNPLPSTITWTVENPTEPISANALPGSADMLLGTLKNGETWTDNSLRKDWGSIYYTKMGDGEFKSGFKLNLFNPATGKEELRNIPGVNLPYYGTDWIGKHNIMIEELRKIKTLSNNTKQTYIDMRGTRDVNELLNSYADQLGVDPATFTQ